MQAFLIELMNHFEIEMTVITDPAAFDETDAGSDELQ